MLWRIYYSDGSTFSNLDGAWADAPADGVVCVNVIDPARGKITRNGQDFYYSQNGSPDEVGSTDDISPQVRARCPWLKYGLGVPRKLYLDILLAATRDPEFPKSQAVGGED